MDMQFLNPKHNQYVSVGYNGNMRKLLTTKNYSTLHAKIDG